MLFEKGRSMVARIKLWFINEKNLMKMSKFVLLTISLLLLTWIFDHGFPELKDHVPDQLLLSVDAVSYTHLTLPTNREV